VKRYRVVIPPIVAEQVRDQVLHIARDSIDNALAWEDRLRAAIKGLGNMPGFSVDQDASARLGEPIRRYVFERTYLIHYRVTEATRRVDVINFRHGARLPRLGEP
jgi:plasmid stabilization system protein ParE